MNLLQSMLRRKKNSNGPPVFFPCNPKTNLILSFAIFPQGIVISHRPSLFFTNSNNCNIIGFHFFTIHHYYFFLLTFWQSHTWEGWYHNYILIHFLSTKKQTLSHNINTKTSHINNILCTEVHVNHVSMKTPRTITPLFNQCNSINHPLPYLK